MVRTPGTRQHPPGGLGEILFASPASAVSTGLQPEGGAVGRGPEIIARNAAASASQPPPGVAASPFAADDAFPPGKARHGVRVETGSRLHWGLWAWGDVPYRAFGGIGMMIDSPSLRLTVRPTDPAAAADQAAAAGPGAERALQTAVEAGRKLLERLPEESSADEALRRCVAEGAWVVEVESAPAPHVGLGSGTQTTLAAWSAVWTILVGRPPSVAELLHGAAEAGRGRRSSIGMHGFCQGGLLAEAGRRNGGLASPLLVRLEAPPDWRVVLVRPKVGRGLSGAAEREAFARLPPLPRAATDRLCGLAFLDLIPAFQEGDFTTAAAALGEYGRTVGDAFAPCQAGTYATAPCAAWADRLRRRGWLGTAQSSWGPTLSVLAPSADAAAELCEEVRRAEDAPPAEASVALPRRRPAGIEPLA